VRKTEEFVSPSDSLETELQDKDGETRRESEAARGTEEVPDSTRMKAALRQHGSVTRSSSEDKAEFDAKSEQVKEQLKHEFPDLFTDPQSLPPLRHQNRRIELEEGATLSDRSRADYLAYRTRRWRRHVGLLMTSCERVG
jgi:molecular chaperone DnaK (HSP70)